jgi:ribonuclease PH
MRVDGRKLDELRQAAITPGYILYPEGSVLISMGLTRVVCTATVEDGVPRWMKAQGKPGGWITAEYAMLPRATQTRTPRETSGLGGRTQEIRRMIGRSLRSAVYLEKLGERTVTLDCDVLQADGGTRTAAITGSYVALAIALGKLVESGEIPPDTLYSPVAAVSVGVINGQPHLDLCYAEDATAEVDVNVVMNTFGEYIEVQGTAERAPFSRSMLDELLKLAYKGIGELLAIQSHALAALEQPKS